MSSATRDALTAALSRSSGLDLDAYRSDYVAERVRRALSREGVDNISQLASRLNADAAARARFRRSIAVSVSGMFRDPGQFDLLERRILPMLLADRRRLAVWSAGCADGSELYTVAMLLDGMGALERAFLLGSDLLEENLERARRGSYDGFSVPPDLRARVRWERRDLVSDGPPPGRWRLVLCRNVAIYLAPRAKAALHRMLADALTPGGVLLVGRSERIADARALGLEQIARHAYRSED